MVGEYRFLGLYTHAAYHESITRIPVLRRKLDVMLEAAGLTADSHDGQDLTEILEGYPREELFQISAAGTHPDRAGRAALRERRQTRLFLRRDVYGRYMSCLVYLPRDRYTTAVRLRAQEILRQALGGVAVDYSATVGDSALARLHVVVRAERGQPLADVDAAELEARLAAAVRSWDEDLAAAAQDRLGEEGAQALLTICQSAIPETYKADVPAVYALDDLTQIVQDAGIRPGGGVRAVGGRGVLRRGTSRGRPAGRPLVWRLTIYRTGSPITLTEVLPRLQHMGVEVVDEHPYEFAAPAWPSRSGSTTSGCAAAVPPARERPRRRAR